MRNDNNPALPYTNSTTAPDSPITVDRSPANIQSTMPSTSAAPAENTPSTSIGVLRKEFGPQFAAGYGDNDTLGELLGKAGAADLDEYLKKNKS